MCFDEFSKADTSEALFSTQFSQVTMIPAKNKMYSSGTHHFDT